MGVLTWADLPFKLTATGRLPADLFRAPLARMEAAWGESGLAKQSCNSMLGLWMLDETFSYKLSTSEHPGDVPPNALKRLTQVGDTVVTDLISKTKLVSTTSMRPIHDLAMSTESVRCGQMIYTLERQRCTIYEFKTDSVI